MSESDTLPTASTRESLGELAALMAEIQRRSSRRKIQTYYPAEGPLRRGCTRSTWSSSRRVRSTANDCCWPRTGSARPRASAATKWRCTSPGWYPEWWPGKRFTKANRWWVAGDTSQTVRDILQYKLLGPPGQMGTGLIPGDAIINTTAKAGIGGAMDTVTIAHASGQDSLPDVQVLRRGPRESFQGTELDGVWLDEEPGLAVWCECATRLMTTNGMMICTFTPLNGLSETVLQFLPDGQMPDEQGRRVTS